MSDKTIVPAQTRILAQMIYAPNKLNGWLYVPETDTKKNYSMKAKILSIGKCVQLDELQLDDTIIFKPGIGEYTFNTIKLNHNKEETYVVLKQDEILAIIKDDQIMPINRYLLCERYKQEEISSSGIILSQDKNKDNIKESKLIKTKFIRADKKLQENLNIISENAILNVSFFYTYIDQNSKKEYQFMQKEDVWLIEE